jgi:hypothetical protein
MYRYRICNIKDRLLPMRILGMRRGGENDWLMNLCERTLKISHKSMTEIIPFR